MAIATLVEVDVTYSAPPNIIATYEMTDSTGLIEITLPGLTIDEDSYHHIPNTDLNGVAYAIQLLSFAISCDSANFNVRVLDINDITRLSTINEVLSYNNVNLSYLDTNFLEFVIKNRDNPITNKLYLYLENASGTITLVLTYLNLQDRLF